MPCRVVWSPGLEADQQIDTPAAGHEVEQFGVLEAVGGDQAAPLFAERGDGGEEFPGVFHVIHQADVVEGEMSALDAANVADHVGHRPLEVAAAKRH